MDEEIRKGIKTFFLNADASLNLEASQLQGFFLSGFEVYPLPENRLVPVTDQIDCLAAQFRELIIFVNISSPPPTGETWELVIPQLRKYYGHRIRFGVLHHEADPDRRARLEQVYLMGAQVQAGCILIDQSRSPDLKRIHKILVANEANGRRRAIRMTCKGRLNLTVDKTRLDARVIEISVSHFLCVFHGADPRFAVSERLKGIQFIAGGMVINLDAIVLLKRESGNGSPEMVYVCGFLMPGATDLGLGPDETAGLIQLIQAYCTVQVHEVIQAAFQKRRKQLVLAGEPQAPKN